MVMRKGDLSVTMCSQLVAGISCLTASGICLEIQIREQLASLQRGHEVHMGLTASRLQDAAHGGMLQVR